MTFIYNKRDLKVLRDTHGAPGTQSRRRCQTYPLPNFFKSQKSAAEKTFGILLFLDLKN